MVAYESQQHRLRTGLVMVPCVPGMLPDGWMAGWLAV